MEGWQTTKRRKTNSTQNEPKGPEGREGTVENLNRASRETVNQVWQLIFLFANRQHANHSCK
jgi:hypothetical protein